MESDEDRRNRLRHLAIQEIQDQCWENIKMSPCKTLCVIFLPLLLFALLVATPVLSKYYRNSSKELETLKSTEKKYLRAPDITKEEKEMKKWNLNVISKVIEDEEYCEFVYFVSYITCLTVTIAIFTVLLIVCVTHAVSEYLEHIDNTEYCWEICLFLQFISAYFYTRRFENLVNRTASNSSVTYSTAAPENVFFQGTRNIEESLVEENSAERRASEGEESVVQETSAERQTRDREESVVQGTSADLPGIPSTSNN